MFLTSVFLVCSEKDRLSFRTSLVESGCVIHVDNDSLDAKLQEFLNQAAPYLFCIHKPLPFPFETTASDQLPVKYEYNTGDNTDPATKKLLSMWNKMYNMCYKSIESQGTVSLLAERILRVDDSTDISEIVKKLGTGVKAPEQDPGYVLTFVGIPGLGKSALIDGIDLSNRSDVWLQVVSR